MPQIMMAVIKMSGEMGRRNFMQLLAGATLQPPYAEGKENMANFGGYAEVTVFNPHDPLDYINGTTYALSQSLPGMPGYKGRFHILFPPFPALEEAESRGFGTEMEKTLTKGGIIACSNGYMICDVKQRITVRLLPADPGVYHDMKRASPAAVFYDVDAALRKMPAGGLQEGCKAFNGDYAWELLFEWKMHPESFSELLKTDKNASEIFQTMAGKYFPASDAAEDTMANFGGEMSITLFGTADKRCEGMTYGRVTDMPHEGYINRFGVALRPFGRLDEMLNTGIEIKRSEEMHVGVMALSHGSMVFDVGKWRSPQKAVTLEIAPASHRVKAAFSDAAPGAEYRAQKVTIMPTTQSNLIRDFPNLSYDTFLGNGQIWHIFVEEPR